MILRGVKRGYPYLNFILYLFFMILLIAVLWQAHYELENKIVVGVVLGLLITYKFYP